MDERGQVHVYSRNWELDSMSSSMQLAKRFQLDKMLWPGMAVQFELCGPGIQSNRLKLPAQRPFVFAVWKDHHKIRPATSGRRECRILPFPNSTKTSGH
ncbi:MAG: hypothetical protein ACLT3W_00465 [Bifidobacterium pseudocatenulatum]